MSEERRPIHRDTYDISWDQLSQDLSNANRRYYAARRRRRLRNRLPNRGVLRVQPRLPQPPPPLPNNGRLRLVLNRPNPLNRSFSSGEESDGEYPSPAHSPAAAAAAANPPAPSFSSGEESDGGYPSPAVAAANPPRQHPPYLRTLQELEDSMSHMDTVEIDENERIEREGGVPETRDPDSAPQLFVPQWFNGFATGSPSRGTLMNCLYTMGIIFRDANGQYRIDLDRFDTLWTNVENGVPDPGADRDAKFVRNIIKRMCIRRDEDEASLFDGDMPHITSAGLVFDWSSVKNLQIAIFMYLVYLISMYKDIPGIYNTIAATSNNWSLELVTNELVSVHTNHTVNLDKVVDVFSKIKDLFYNRINQLFDDEDVDMKDFDSGEVIRIQEGVRVCLRISLIQIASFRVGAKWNPKMEPFLREVFHNQAIATVKNETDDLCLFYCMCMGFLLLKWDHNNVFGEKFIDPNKLNRMYEMIPDSDPGKKLLMKIKYDRADMEKFIEDHQDVYTTKEVYRIFKEAEDRFLEKGFGLDIFICDIGVRDGVKAISKVYPCYASMRKTEKRIPLLMLSSGSWKHYFLITSSKSLFNITGGKIFITCSKCHQTFYSKSTLDNHDCGSEDRAMEYHWNISGCPDTMTVQGVCERCHLKFVTAEEYEYHKKHCFMRQKSGNRYVQLSEETTLKGVETDGEFTLPDKRLYFADFECCIAESGEHEFMSFGLYDANEGRFYGGFEMETFMMLLKQFSREHGTIYVYFHNAMNYDVNFVLRYVLKHEKSFSASVIMKSMNKFQSVRLRWKEPGVKELHKIVIGDTFQFMTMSLDRIVASVRTDDVEHNKHVFSQFFGTFHDIFDPMRDSPLPDEQIDLVLHKNLFPYKFFDSPEKLKTPYFTFFSIFEPLEENLKYFSEGVTVADLEENKKQLNQIKRAYRMNFARDYHNLYLLCDVMQITDVFLNARRTLAGTHKIDICDYIGMPSASWNAFLRFNPSLELPLYQNTRLAEFFMSMTRGGVTSAPLRHAKADAGHSIIYFDVNGLYPHVMRSYDYPCGEMFWYTFSELVNDDPAKYFMEQLVPRLTEQHKGCCLCVDLHFTDELKRRTDQFPFAPEHKLLKDCYTDADGELYPFLKDWSAANDGEKMKPFIGLVGTLYDKKEYGVHWRLLKWYIEHGVVLTRLHYGVFFEEGDYLKGYVSLNIECRNKRHDELGKMVYKLMGNSIYGKTFESPFNRGKFLVIRNREKLRGLMEEGNVASITAIDEENSIVKMDGDKVVLDKPTYIGACVTEYAKLHMYELFYDKLCSLFPHVELVYTDTDSFIVRISHPPGWTPTALFQYIEFKCPDLIGGLGGQIKSETGTDLIEEVIALRSKLYCYRTLSGKVGKRAKGTTKAARDQELTWDKYKAALKDLKNVYTQNAVFQRRALKISSVKMGKCSISVNDGKRYILPDGIHTHAFGHPDIMSDE